MYSELGFWLYAQMESLEEPMRFLAYLCLYIVVPLFLVFLVWLDRKIEERKIK